MPKVDIIREFRAELTKVRDNLLDIGDFLEKGENIRAAKILGILNPIIGAQFKFEEESLYPLLTPYLSEFMSQIVQGHAEARSSARRLAEILSNDDLSKGEKMEAGWWELRSLLDYVASCDNLLVTMKQLTEEELYQLSLKFQEAKGAKVPLLDWTMQDFKEYA